MRALPLLVALTCLMVPALAQTPVRAGDMDKLVLSAGAEAAKWNVAEATMAPATEPTLDGTEVHHFHIDVDHHAGEAAYPIGWPRTNLPLTEPWQRDWSGYDFFRFSVYAQTSAEKLPTTPLGMLLHIPDRANQFNMNLLELVKDQWVEVTVPISRIARHEDVRLIQFFISESNYADGDVLDFYISDLCLLRYATPHLSEVAVKPSVAYADALYVVVGLRALGIAEGQTARATVGLLDGERQVATTQTEVGRGPAELPLNLRAHDLAPGTYTVRIALDGGEPQDYRLRVVPSPWE